MNRTILTNKAKRKVVTSGAWKISNKVRKMCGRLLVRRSHMATKFWNRRRKRDYSQFWEVPKHDTRVLLVVIGRPDVPAGRGATSHTTGKTSILLIETSPKPLISKRSKVNWSVRSCAIILCDFFFWYDLESEAYANNPNHIVNLIIWPHSFSMFNCIMSTF